METELFFPIDRSYKVNANRFLIFTFRTDFVDYFLEVKEKTVLKDERGRIVNPIEFITVQVLLTEEKVNEQELTYLTYCLYDVFNKVKTNKGEIESLLLFDEQYLGLEWEPNKIQLFVNHHVYNVSEFGCFTFGMKLYKHFAFENPTFAKMKGELQRMRGILNRISKKNEDLSSDEGSIS
jgi:hypothetical protein